MRYLRPAKFSTIYKADAFILELELSARGQRCEVPHCAEIAVGYFSDEMPAFICTQHMDAKRHGLGPQIKAKISAHQRELVLAAANRAWAGTEDEGIFTYDPGAAVQRFIEAPTVTQPVRQAVSSPAVRPSITTLDSANAQVPLMEFFPLL